MMPSFFIAHGSPMLAIEDNEYTRELNELGKQLGKPEAVVIYTAHWLSRTLTVTETDETYRTIYDFGGFPKELFEVVYPAKGSAKIAEEVAGLLEGSGIEVNRDTARGLDHGVWVILRHLFPNADVPVIAVSVNPLLPPEEQYRIGAALTELKKRNVLILGSGGTVHNFAAINFANENAVTPWAEEFDIWLIEHMKKWDTASLFDYKQRALHAAYATPDYEHFLPLFIAMGSGDDVKQAKALHRSYRYGSLSHVIMQFG
jgi:4,5-DOPA dioxygenase extradiol